jgi:type IV secretory pathway TrbL component
MFTGQELLLISGGINAAGTVLGFGSAYSADKINEIVADTEAKLVAENAKTQAALIRREGDAVAGSARTAMAASAGMIQPSRLTGA